VAAYRLAAIPEGEKWRLCLEKMKKPVITAALGDNGLVAAKICGAG
jgi:hypothetical protein